MFSLHTISTQHQSLAATYEAPLRFASTLRGLEMGSVYGELADSSCWAVDAQRTGDVSESVTAKGLRLDGASFGNDDQLPCPDVDTKPIRFGLRRPYKRLE